MSSRGVNIASCTTHAIQRDELLPERVDTFIIWYIYTHDASDILSINRVYIYWRWCGSVTEPISFSHIPTSPCLVIEHTSGYCDNGNAKPDK